MANGLRIVSKRDGFRRGGIAHPATPTDHALDALTEEQFAAIVAEPMLVVARIEVDGKGPDKEPESTGPSDPEERIGAIKAAIGGLAKEHWTGTGKPKVDALEATLGWTISGAERDAAAEGMTPPAT